MFKFERGDSIEFGEKYCKEHGYEYLTGKTIMMTPQYFEDDNGLYCYQVECAGIYDEVNEEPMSVYHLFGNDFENFMDCELVRGTEEDKDKYQNILNQHKQSSVDASELWISFMEGEIN